MTTGLTTAATLAVMLLHAAFGCCWHHEHGRCAATEAGDDHTAASCDHDHEGHEHDRGEGHSPHFHLGGEAPEGGHDHGDCASDMCRFVSSAPMDLPLAEVSWVGVSGTEAGLASLLVAVTSGADSARCNGCDGGSAPPLRLLTRLCVWRL